MHLSLATNAFIGEDERVYRWRRTRLSLATNAFTVYLAPERYCKSLENCIRESLCDGLRFTLSHCYLTDIKDVVTVYNLCGIVMPHCSSSLPTDWHSLWMSSQIPCFKDQGRPNQATDYSQIGVALSTDPGPAYYFHFFGNWEWVLTRSTFLFHWFYGGSPLGSWNRQELETICA